MSIKEKYTILFYTPKPNKIIINEHLKLDDLELKEEFFFYDYDFKQTIKNLKIYFFSAFGHKYNCCYCQLSLYQINPKLFSSNLIYLNKEETYLAQLDTKLYLVFNSNICNCLLKEYKNFLFLSKYDLIREIMKEKQLYLDMLKQKNNLENSLDKIKKENDTLKIEKEDLENIKERITKVNEKDNLNEEDFYDISIEIKSIKDLQKGWKLIMNDKGKNTYEKNKNKLLLRIGAIGNSKKGKSFLLNKISHIDLMIGVSIQSSGLNIKYPETEEHSQIIILDSAGLEKPLLKENKNMIENDEDNENKIDQKNDINLNEENLKKEFQDMSKDKIITELFLQKFIIKSSDILLLVVGSLTYSEQLLINNSSIN